ncbi:MAG: CAAX prenyl protease-related protein [Chthoniobacterales bacterium]
MHSATDQRSRNLLIAYAAPMVVFIGCFGLISLIKLTHGQSLWLRSPEFWVYPLQTVACAVLLIIFWRRYEFHPVRQLWLVLLVGSVSLAIWIAPQAFFGAAPRTDGFNPDLIASNPAAYWATVLLRFFRLVVVVPLIEEIFWRGFLLRYLIDEKFERVPFGTFSWLSFAVVTLAFTFSHSSADWIVAAVVGSLFNLVAYRTKSLTSCVLVHAITNLLLGLWIMQTKQWGFW